MKKKRVKKRVDQLLIDREIARDLTSAQALIMAGKVLVNDQMVDKPGSLVAVDLPIRLKKQESAFVSRGGEKLSGAFEDFALNEFIVGKTVLDVGASTGGFTHCCLEMGAKHVISLDVGTAQLAWEIRNHPAVTVLEKTNLRDFNPGDFPNIDFIVADVSFNSLARMAPYFYSASPTLGTRCLLLVKPQFELDRQDIPTGGIVVDPAARLKAVDRVSHAFAERGYTIIGSKPSRVLGRGGNQEIFLLVQLAN